MHSRQALDHWVTSLALSILRQDLTELPRLALNLQSSSSTSPVAGITNMWPSFIYGLCALMPHGNLLTLSYETAQRCFLSPDQKLEMSQGYCRERAVPWCPEGYVRKDNLLLFLRSPAQFSGDSESTTQSLIPYFQTQHGTNHWSANSSWHTIKQALQWLELWWKQMKFRISERLLQFQAITNTDCIFSLPGCSACSPSADWCQTCGCKVPRNDRAKWSGHHQTSFSLPNTFFFWHKALSYSEFSSVRVSKV